MDAPSGSPRRRRWSWAAGSGGRGDQGAQSRGHGRGDVAPLLTRWKVAGLLDDAQASAILAFEMTDTSVPRAGRTRVGLQEVVAYAGAAVTLAGVVLAIGLHYGDLGIGGRLAIYTAVTAAAFLAAHQLSGRGGAGERASAAFLMVGILGCGAMVGDTTATIGLATRHEHVTFGGDSPGGGYDTVDYSGNVALGFAVVSGLALLALLRRAGILVALTLVGSAFATTYASLDAAGNSSATVAGLIGLIPGFMLVALAQRQTLGGTTAGEVLRTFGVLVPTAALYAVGGDAPAVFAALGGVLSVGALAGAVRLGSPGLAVAGGLGLFGLVADVVARYFADALGAPIAFVVSGLTLMAVSWLIHRIIRGTALHGRGSEA
jgi:hypothetical protein